MARKCGTICYTMSSPRLTLTLLFGTSLAVLGGGCSSEGPAEELEVSVEPGSLVRQGQSEIRVTLEQRGGDLSQVSEVSLEDLEVTVDPGSSDERLLLWVTVPHGSRLGPRKLTLTRAAAILEFEEVLEISPIVASPEGTDTSAGTTAAPFRSLARALSVTGSGDTVRLGAGRYDTDSGERWKYRAPAGVEITGEGREQSLLVADATGSDRAFDVAGSLGLKGLTLVGFEVGLKVTEPGDLSLTDVVIQDSWSAGIELEPSAGAAILRAQDLAITSPAGSGIIARAPGARLELVGGELAVGGSSIILDHCDDCELEITETRVASPASDLPAVHVFETCERARLVLEAAEVAGSVFMAASEGVLSVNASSLKGNGSNAGLNFAGAEAGVTGSTVEAADAAYGIALRGGSLTLEDVHLVGNNYGLYQIGGGSRLRRTRVEGYGSIGVYFASGWLDLGTGEEAGENALLGRAESLFGIYVDTGIQRVTSSATRFNGVIPPPGIVTAGEQGLAEPGQYFLGPGQSLEFFEAP